MNILFISTWFPFPLNNGSRIRVYHLLRALSKNHRVHLIAFLPPEIDKQVTTIGRQEITAARQVCASIEWVERDPFWRDPRQRLSAHFSLTPRDVLRGSSTEMGELVRMTASERTYDVIIASTIDAAQYAGQVDHPRRILEEHNFTTAWMEERYRHQAGPIHRVAGWITWQKCQRYERRLYAEFAAVTMVSENDLRAVRESMPGYHGRLEVIPNGVDLETRRFGMSEPQMDTLVFNGSLTYTANLEAIRWFVAEVWPLIQQKRPRTRLAITGNTDGLDLSWLAGDPSITLTGYLEDVRPVVAQSWLAVAPLRSGGGTRLKILEAMALGTPVTATSKGAEGLDVTPDKNILIADNPDDFALQCLRILDSTSLRSTLAGEARHLVEQNYDWAMIGKKFCELVESVAAT